MAIIDNTIASQMPQYNAMTPLAEVAKVQNMQTEAKAAQFKQIQTEIGSEARGLTAFVNTPEFPARWAETLDRMAAKGLVNPQLHQQWRNTPSPLLLKQMITQTEDPTLTFRKEEAGREQRNQDRSFAQSKSNADRQFGLEERKLSATLAGGKIPAGFEANPEGGLRPVRGGPADPAYKRTVTDKQNAPPGYKWVDPSNPEAGLAPIPGGPGEKVPAEVAARLGLAKSFIGQLEDYKDVEGKDQTGLRARIKAGEATGIFNGPMASANLGEPGSIRRKISSGAEALLRNLTGAGMNIDEAKKYVSRYEPQWNDSAGTLLDKVNQLERELRAVDDTVSKGRGGHVITDKPKTKKSITQEEYSKLQPGEKYIAPDGTERTKR